MVSCMYIFHHCTLRFEGNKYIIIIIKVDGVESGQYMFSAPVYTHSEQLNRVDLLLSITAHDALNNTDQPTRRSALLQ